ncbi:MAG: transglutaminase family protein [Mucilaginibacter polytrichastri]|nr:transglutaminase family protein [Mucilaginibacter polytrichastri]
MVNKSEIDALIRLLDDPDQEIYGHVEERLLGYGGEVIGHLEAAWESAFDPLLQERIAHIVHHIQYDSVKKDLQLWVQGGGFDLLQGVLIINRYQYPDLDEQKIINQIEDIKRDAWLQLSQQGSAVEQIKTLNHVLYSIHGFRGNTTNHLDPQNSYISQVLESKRGNQISLAIIYSTIAQRLDIPVFGVNLPQHFILAYVEEGRKNEGENGILFYINAFNKGFMFGKRDVDLFLKQLGLQQDSMFYEPCSNTDILKRVLRNLISAYENLGTTEKVLELNALLEILER